MSGVLLQKLNTYISSIDEKLGTLLPQNPPPPPLVSPPPVHHIRKPEYRPAELFDGHMNSCGGFLLQFRLAITRSPSLFPDNFSKITFLVIALKGRALQWALSSIQSHSQETLPCQRFIQEFHRVIHHPLQQEAAGKHLISLRQGRKSVADHFVNFWIIAEETGWDDSALKSLITNSLLDSVVQLVTQDEPNSLDEFITLAIRIDNRLQKRRREKDYSTQRPSTSAIFPISVTQFGKPASPEPGPESMQVGSFRLSHEERQRRLN